MSLNKMVGQSSREKRGKGRKLKQQALPSLLWTFIYHKEKQKDATEAGENMWSSLCFYMFFKMDYILVYRTLTEKKILCSWKR